MLVCNKANIKKFCIVLAFFIISMALIIFFSLLRRDVSEKSLEKSVITVLTSYDPGRFSLVREFSYHKPIESALKVYEITDSLHSSQIVYAALIRITGFSGPQSCVLVLHPESHTTTFVGIAGIPFPQHSTVIDYGISGSMIQYWEKNILQILQEGGIL